MCAENNISTWNMKWCWIIFTLKKGHNNMPVWHIQASCLSRFSCGWHTLIFLTQSLGRKWKHRTPYFAFPQTNAAFRPTKCFKNRIYHIHELLQAYTEHPKGKIWHMKHHFSLHSQVEIQKCTKTRGWVTFSLKIDETAHEKLFFSGVVILFGVTPGEAGSKIMAHFTRRYLKDIRSTKQSN